MPLSEKPSGTPGIFHVHVLCFFVEGVILLLIGLVRKPVNRSTGVLTLLSLATVAVLRPNDVGDLVARRGAMSIAWTYISGLD